MANNVQVIRDRSGRIIGKIETENNGNKIVRDFYGHILGRYDKRSDVTRDFYGRIVARGDSCGILLTTK